MVKLCWIYVSLRWERSDCIQVIVFLGGHVAHAARRLATGSTAWVWSWVSGWGEGDFLHSMSRLLLGSSQPTIKWVPGSTFSKCRGCVYIGMCTLASTSPWAFMAYNGDIFYRGFLMWKCSTCPYGFTTHRCWIPAQHTRIQFHQQLQRLYITCVLGLGKSRLAEQVPPW